LVDLSTNIIPYCSWLYVVSEWTFAEYFANAVKAIGGYAQQLLASIATLDLAMMN